MPEKNSVTNIVIAGLGGQGVITSSDIVAEAAFRSGFDVKKSEIHGMSRRGGSVSSDVRFGHPVLSPMVTSGEADYLVILDSTQIEPNSCRLRPGGIVLHPGMIDTSDRTLNVSLLGILSANLTIPEEAWLRALRHVLRSTRLESNMRSFRAGRAMGICARSSPIEDIFV